MITIHSVENAMDFTGRKTCRKPAGQTLLGLLPEGFDLDLTHCVTPHGAIENQDFHTYRPESGAHVTFIQRPAAIGVVATIIINVVLSAALQAAQYFLFKPEAEEELLPKAEKITHTFNGLRTIAANAAPILVGFGEHPLGGNMLAMHTQSTTASSTNGGRIRGTELYLTIGLCEGPIYGGDQFIRVNGNRLDPALFPTATFQVGVRTGELDQDPLSIGGTSKNQLQVNVELKSDHEGPTNEAPSEHLWKQAETANEVDRVRIITSHPRGLYRSHLNGGYSPAELHYQVRYRRVDEPDNWLGPGGAGDDYWGGPNGAGSVRIEATEPFAFQVQEEFELPSKDKWIFQARRWTRSTQDRDVHNDLVWDSIVELQDEIYSWPGLAYTKLRFTASEEIQNSIPDVIVDNLKLLKVNRVTANLDIEPVPEDEDFNNPSWCLLTLLQDDYWGLAAEFAEAELDLQSFYDFGLYCNEIVSDGFGGQQVRHTFDGVFEGETGGNALQRIAQVANASIIKVGSSLKMVWDRPRQPRHMVTMGNIRPGTFKRAWFDEDLAATRTAVRFLNKAEDYSLDIAYFDDPEATAAGLPQVIQKHDYFGITNRTRAIRMAKYLHQLKKITTEGAEWESDIDTIAFEPGDVVLVAHDLPQWGITSGRVQVALGTSITIDRELEIPSGTSYVIQVRSNNDDLIEVRNITSPAGFYEVGDTLTIDSAFDSNSVAKGIYSIGRQNIVTKPMVVQSIIEQPDHSNRVVAVEYNEAIFENLDDIQAPEIVYTELPDPFIIPPCLAEPPLLSQRLESNGVGGFSHVVDVSWQLPDPTASQIIAGSKVYYREIGDFTDEEVNAGAYTLFNSYDASVSNASVPNLNVGSTYRFVVVMVSSSGGSMSPSLCQGSEIEITGQGPLTDAPPNFAAVQAGTEVLLTWDNVPNAIAYEIRRGYEWTASRLVGQTTAPTNNHRTTYWTPTDNGGPGFERFFIRGISAAGLYGDISQVDVSLANTFNSNYITQDEGTTKFLGNKNNCKFSGGSLSANGPNPSYTTLDMDVGAIRNVRVSAQLFADVEGWENYAGLNYANHSAQGSLNSYAALVDPSQWPYNLQLELKTATTQAGLTSASWQPFLTGIRVDTRWLRARFTWDETSGITLNFTEFLISVEET